MDMNPYIYKTEDFGNNWKLISNGIDGENNFVRVVRADKKINGLLYAGTETGFLSQKMTVKSGKPSTKFSSSAN